MFGAEAFVSKNSGIGRVARLSARVLHELVLEGKCDARLVALNDPTPCYEFVTNTATARSNRIKFVSEITCSHFSHTHFLYDFLGMARAHGMLPFPKRPFMVWLHGIEVWEGTPANRIETAKKASQFVINSHFSRQRAADNYAPFGEADVCWLATEDAEAPAPATSEPTRPTALILSRILERKYSHKGHYELLEAWEKVVEKVPDALLLIAGGGPGVEELRKFIAESKVADSVECLGFVPDEEMDALWRRSTVFVMPSRGEGFGLVYIEAMRYGLPIIGSIHDAATEVNVHGETGYNVSLDRPDELPARLIELFEQESLAKEMGANGFARWQNHFTFSAFRERFRPLLLRFLAS
jgi:phosphatidylinositol alpha-1,6-mannosyltransferase